MTRLDARAAPVLAPGVPYLLQALSSDTNSFQQIVATLERFPGITFRLIALANSGWSSPARPIDSLEQACTRLGLDIVRTVSIAVCVAAPFNPQRCPAFDREHYWTHAMLTAAAAREFATLSARELRLDPPAAHAAGLLHRIGLLWLASQLPAELDSMLRCRRTGSGHRLGELMRSRIGTDYAAAGVHLGRAWGLSESILDPMIAERRGAEERVSPMVTVVRSARAVSSILLEDEEAIRQPYERQLARDHATARFAGVVREQVRDRLPMMRALAKELFAA
ncbi:HDOD domain-containing protein [Thiorhodococcus minor]|uniref:HDOD domain-containing protein n=1 Tax=Thiorhodococcus minor TaxID=57489 RepID=A0A6M0K0X5_9GAMM|nr:HDOD domain-containing protein [Thiorhodococcus minor]NEV63400.1 HDOD domain-containing protein [Thiorhodococcus minor]